MAATTTVRVHPETRLALARLSAQRGLTVADLLAELVERGEQDELLERMNASFDRRLVDSVAQQGERVERELWEATLPDGLDEL